MRNLIQVTFLTNAKSAGHWQARRDNYQVSSAKPKVGTQDYHASATLIIFITLVFNTNPHHIGLKGLPIHNTKFPHTHQQQIN